jgi:hypothetical protein
MQSQPDHQGKIRYFGHATVSCVDDVYPMVGFSTLIPVSEVSPDGQCWVSILVNPSYVAGHVFHPEPLTLKV